MLDYLSLTTNWHISRPWNASLRADFTHRESTTPTEEVFTVIGPDTTLGIPGATQTDAVTSFIVPQAIDTFRWGVEVRVERRITERLLVLTRYAYNGQTSKGGTVGRGSDFENHVVGLGIEYQVGRWHLW